MIIMGGIVFLIFMGVLLVVVYVILSGVINVVFEYEELKDLEKVVEIGVKLGVGGVVGVEVGNILGLINLDLDGSSVLWIGLVIGIYEVL